MKEKALLFLSGYNVTDSANYMWVENLQKRAVKKYLLSTVEKSSPQAMNYFDEVIQLNDLYDLEHIYAYTDEIAEAYEIVAVYAPKESLVEIAGEIRERYNVSGMKKKDAQGVRNKYLQKKILSRAGIKTSKAEIATSLASAIEIAESFTYPVVVKPVNGFATQNTRVIQSNSELTNYFESQTELHPALQKISTNQVLVESFTSGEEYHCDSVVQNGEVAFVSVSKYLTNCINTVESDIPVGSITFPNKKKNNDAIEKIKSVNQTVIQVLNIENSVTHAEYFVDKKGNVAVGEIATRVGGPFLVKPQVFHSHGLNIFKAMNDIEFGEFVPPEKESISFSGVIAFAVKPGKIIHIAEPADFRHIHGVKEIKIDAKIGDELGSKSGTLYYTGTICLSGNSFEEVEKNLKKANQIFMDKFEVAEQKN